VTIDWNSVLSQIITPVLVMIGLGLVNFLLPKIPGATKKGFDWLAGQTSKVKNQYLAGVLQRAAILVRDHVLLLENTEIELLKEKAAKGEITKDALPALLAAVKQKAIDMAKEHATAQDLWKDLLTVFMGNENALMKWLGDQVETQVSTLPASGLQSPVGDSLSAMAAGLAPVVPQKAASKKG
jgi:hypothetical protein